MENLTNLRPDGLTLDQLVIFVTVVEEGSFSAAARRMNRAQSVITYGIQNLEGQVGTELFDRNTYRPALTMAGIVLLPLARRILDDATEFRKIARNLTAGIEARLYIAIDIAAPKQRLLAALQDMSVVFPTVEVTMQTQPLRETVRMLRAGDVDLGLIVEAPVLGPLSDLDRQFVDHFKFLPVASPSHPLAQQGRTLVRDDLVNHMQVLLSADHHASGLKDLSAHASIRWRVNDLSLRHTCILKGLGWGRMPDFMIEEDVAAGRLIVLDFDKQDTSLDIPSVSVSAATLRSRSVGPAGRWLIDRLAQLSRT